MSEQQWAYRHGHSTELLLVHLTETWRRAVDSKLVVGVVFVDFKKAFNIVSHQILERKLRVNFGIDGPLLAWLRIYLKDRKQYTIVNGKCSNKTSFLYGIPQGPTLFILFTNDLSSAVKSGAVYMYADDRTLHSIERTTEEVTYALTIVP